MRVADPGRNRFQEGFRTMKRVDRRPGLGRRTPTFEGLESRSLLTATLPDIAVLAARTGDSRGVTLDYDIVNAPVTQPVHIEVYRSTTAQAGADASPIGGVD